MRAAGCSLIRMRYEEVTLWETFVARHLYYT